MKTTMDRDTILFVDDNDYGLGMDYRWYTKNYTTVSESYGTPKKIFYKCREGVNSWVDFERAIQYKKGTISERLELALADSSLHVDIKDIPPTDFYDKDGFKHVIAPYDGVYEPDHWLPRIDKNDLRQGYDYTVTKNGCDLKVTFNVPIDLDNSFITLNNLFYRYTVSKDAKKDFPEIIFFNVADELSVSSLNFSDYNDSEIYDKTDKLRIDIEHLNDLIVTKAEFIKGLEKRIDELNDSLESYYISTQEKLAIELKLKRLEETLKENLRELYNLELDRENKRKEYSRNNGLITKMYNVKLNVYTWDGLNKKDSWEWNDHVHVIKRVGEWFITDKPIDNNSIVIYNGQIVNQTVSKTDPKRFKIEGFSILSLPAFDIVKFHIFRVESASADKCIKKYIIEGYKNKHKDTVEFVLPVKQSLVLYEGVDHDYEIHGEASIKYGFSKGSVDRVSDTARVQSINFSNVGQD